MNEQAKKMGGEAAKGTPKTFTLNELGYLEAIGIMGNRGKCPYCKQVNKSGLWVRTSFVSPGLCMDAAPRCVDCPGRPPSRKSRSALASQEVKHGE